MTQDNESINQENGHMYVSVLSYGDEELENKTIRVPTFGNITPARVRISGSITKNLGNYESAKVEVSIELPCLPVESEISRVSSIIEGWVDEIIQEKVERIDAAKVRK